MGGLENFSLWASMIMAVLAIIFASVAFGARHSASARGISIFTTVSTLLTFLFVTLTIAARWIETGHGPFSNMYEFALGFSWGAVLMGIFFQWRYKTGAFRNIGLFVALLLLLFAIVNHTRPQPLVPALQQSTLLSVHVATAIVAYGTFTIGFGAAVLYLFNSRNQSDWLPSTDILDAMSYQSVIIGFPFLTALIVLGALWADIAWGKYWSWDPKETASLVTWLLYAAYLHARIMRGWRGKRTAVLLIIGFAAVLLTFFGNYIFSGLHAYG